MRRIYSFLRAVSALAIAAVALQGCNSLNPLCGSARPRPSISSLSVTTIPYTDVQQGFVLTVTGSELGSSSVVVINGTALTTLILNSTQLQVTLTTAVIPGPGTEDVAIKTPAGTTGDVGCTSGGTSDALPLSIT